jgi:hypothetical protein
LTNSTNEEQVTVKAIAEALYTINRHAKTAPNPKYLYALKRKAIEKLLQQKKAEKKGIQLSPNPKFSKQQLDVLVQVDNFYFHIPPNKGDARSLPHLGEQKLSYKNPKVRLPLRQATTILESYAGKPSESLKRNAKNIVNKKVYSNDHLFLGK